MWLPHRVSKLLNFTYIRRRGHSSTAPGNTRSLLELPDELLWLILEGLVPPLGPDLAHYKLEAPSELLRLRLTCRRLRDIVTPLAFRRVKLLWHPQGKLGTPLSQPFLTFKTLATANPALLDGIRLLFLEFGTTNKEHKTVMARFLVKALLKMRSLRYLHCTIRSGVHMMEEVRRAISMRAQEGLQTLVLRSLASTGTALPFDMLPHTEMLRLELLHPRHLLSIKLGSIPNLRYLAIFIGDDPASLSADSITKALSNLPWGRLVELDIERVGPPGFQQSKGDAILRALSAGYQVASKSSATPLTALRVCVPFTSRQGHAAFVGQFKRQSLQSLNLIGTLMDSNCLDAIIDASPSITDLSFSIGVNIRNDDFLEVLLTKILNFTSLCRLHGDFGGRPLGPVLSDISRSFVQRVAGLLSPDRCLQIILSEGVYGHDAVINYTLSRSFAEGGESVGYRENIDPVRLGYYRVPTPGWRTPPVGC